MAEDDPADASPPADLTGIRVLVVDDDADARDLTVAALGASGADVFAVASSDQALARLLDGAHPAPHMLIADLGMPGRDGFELIELIRKLDGDVARIPAVAVSGYARDQDRDRARDAGFNQHLAKPITPAALVDAVLRAIRGSA
jgi:CheY-like chemotaxis protein